MPLFAWLAQRRASLWICSVALLLTSALLGLTTSTLAQVDTRGPAPEHSRDQVLAGKEGMNA